MSRSFVTNITHFLDEKGAIPESLPKSAKKLAETMGKIVASVTSPPTLEPKTPIPCWATVKNKRCTGKIDAGIDLDSFDILWHCLHCGNHGAINHWEKTFWDCEYR